MKLYLKLCVVIFFLLIMPGALLVQSSQQSKSDTKPSSEEANRPIKPKKTPKMVEENQPPSSVTTRQYNQARKEELNDAVTAVERVLTSKFKKGDKAIIYNEALDYFAVATTQSVFSLFIKYLKIGNKAGLRTMLLADYIFMPENRTPVTVLDTDAIEVNGNYYLIANVFVMEGREFNKTGWVAEKWLVKG